MSCDIKKIKKDAVEEAASILRGNARSIVRISTNKFYVKGSNFPVTVLHKIADTSTTRVAKWAANKFGEKFSKEWTKIEYNSDGATIYLDFPKRLEKAYEAKENKDTFIDVPNDYNRKARSLEVNPRPKSKLYQKIREIALFTEDEAVAIFKNVFTPEFIKFFGNWMDHGGDETLTVEGEPKLFFRVGTKIFTDIDKAIQESNGLLLEIGFIATDHIDKSKTPDLFTVSNYDLTTDGTNYLLHNQDAFYRAASIVTKASSNTKNGFILNSSKKGLLSAKQVEEDGQLKLEGIGESRIQKQVAAKIAESDAQEKLGTKNVKLSNGKLIIEDPQLDLFTTNDGQKDVSFSETEAIELIKKDPEKARSLFGNLGMFIYNSFLKNQNPPLSKNESNNLQNRLLKLLSDLGVSITSIEEYKKNYKLRTGIDLSVDAIADIANNVIAFADGKLDDNLVEETAHFILEAVPQEKLLEVLGQVEGTAEYSSFYSIYYTKYKELYKSAEEVDQAVRKEIAGKILARKIVQKDTESTFWSIFMDFVDRIKQFFTPSHKKQLDILLDKIAQDVVDDRIDLNNDILSESSLVLYSTGASGQTNNLKAQLMKLEQTLESRISQQGKTKDTEINKTREELKRLEN